MRAVVREELGKFTEVLDTLKDDLLVHMCLSPSFDMYGFKGSQRSNAVRIPFCCGYPAHCFQRIAGQLPTLPEGTEHVIWPRLTQSAIVVQLLMSVSVHL